jgi:DNA-binding response OmpR family regulator
LALNPQHLSQDSRWDACVLTDRCCKKRKLADHLRIGTVLISEPEECVRRLIRTVLEQSGYVVIEGDGHTDWSPHVELGTVDLLLIDLDTTDPRVWKAACHGHGRPGHTNVIFTCASLSDKEAIGLNLIQKPFSIEELLIRVRSALDYGSVRGAKASADRF